MTDNNYTFSLEEIRFPRMLSFFLKEDAPFDDCSIQYKIKPTITDPSKIKILFGIQVLPSKESENYDIKNNVTTVEILGTFNFDSPVFTKIEKIEKIDSIKALPQMIAILFPFVREKLHYLFHNNKIEFYLPPTNIFSLVENFKDQIKIEDLRNLENSSKEK